MDSTACEWVAQRVNGCVLVGGEVGGVIIIIFGMKFILVIVNWT